MAMLSNQEVSDLNATELDDLYAQLGRAADPGHLTVGLEEKNLQTMMAGAAGSVSFWPNWIQRGFNYFDSVWNVVGSTVCAAYKDYSDIDGRWIENLANAIVGLLNIGWAVAVIIVQIAIKRGLAALCPA